MPPTRRLARSTRGQSTALVTSMLFVLALFVGMVVDVGQVVNRRVALQVVADAGAYTGATAMAVGLNSMAYWNAQIQEAWAWMTIATMGFGSIELAPGVRQYPSCAVSLGAAAAYIRKRDYYGGLYEGINRAGAGKATREARRVSSYNMGDLFPGEQGFNFARWDDAEDVRIPRQDTSQLMPSEEVPDGTKPESATPALANATHHATWVCHAGPFLFTVSRDFKTWYRKAQASERQVQYFVWRAQSPRIPMLMFDSIFGRNGMPEMKAVAVAKPVGGWIEKGKSEYVAKMVPVAKVMRNPQALIRDAFARTGTRLVTH